MDKEFAACFRNIKVVFKETLDRKQRFMIQRFNRATLEHFFKEHIAQSGGQLIDQAGNSQIIIADNRPLRIEYLSYLQSNLRFLKGAGQTFTPVTMVPMPTTACV